MENNNLKKIIIIGIIGMIIICIGIISLILVLNTQNENENIINNELQNYNKNTEENDDLEKKLSMMNKATIDITENHLQISDDEVGKCFVIMFEYDSEKPEIGFESPSGRLFYTDCQSDKNEDDFFVDTEDEYTNMRLPFEKGEWTIYYDKKSNEGISYNIMDNGELEFERFMNENSNDNEADTNQEENTNDETNDIEETDIEGVDINDYKKYGYFKRQFVVDIPRGESYDNDMHAVIIGEIASTINQVEDVKFSGYKPNGAQIVIYINIETATSNDDLANKANTAAKNAIDRWNELYNM